MLHDEFAYYIDNQHELIKKYEGRYIVIKDRKIIGDYSSRIEAYRETKKIHALGTFIIQLCEADKNAYSQTFHSLVVSFQ